MAMLTTILRLSANVTRESSQYSHSPLDAINEVSINKIINTIDRVRDSWDDYLQWPLVKLPKWFVTAYKS